MFDLMGSICIVGASVSMLWQRKRENRRKSETFMDLMQALRCLAEGIRLGRIPLPDLLKNIAEGCRADTACFFKRISVALHEERNVVEAWRIAAKDLPLIIDIAAICPKLPHFTPLYIEPCACETSSIT